MSEVQKAIERAKDRTFNGYNPVDTDEASLLNFLAAFISALEAEGLQIVAIDHDAAVIATALESTER